MVAIWILLGTDDRSLGEGPFGRTHNLCPDHGMVVAYAKDEIPYRVVAMAKRPVANGSLDTALVYRGRNQNTGFS